VSCGEHPFEGAFFVAIKGGRAMSEKGRKEFLNELSRFIEYLKKTAAEVFRRMKEFCITVKEQLGKAESWLDARKGWDILIRERKRTVNRYRPIKAVARSALK
jgi:hypothetical protein